MELSLGSFNLHMGRGPGGHDAPFYDVVAAAKEVDTDVLVLQEAWVPDRPGDRPGAGAAGTAGGAPANGPGSASTGLDGDILDIAAGLDYQVAASTAIARATCHDQVRLAGRDGPGGAGDWSIAVLSRLPVLAADVVPLPQLPRDPARRALLVVTVAVQGPGERDPAPFTVVGTHLPLLKDPVWRLRPALRQALPATEQPAAFVGDMNMWGWCVGRLVPRGWRRAVRGRTYPAHRPHSQTDHILVTPPVEVVDPEVLGLVRSDHRPVRARLRF